MAPSTLTFETAEEIRRKQHQWARFIDTKQWAKLHDIALPDATFNFHDKDDSLLKIGTEALSFSSTQAFASFFERCYAIVDTLHMFGPGELKMVNVDEVEAIWSIDNQATVRGTAGFAEMRAGGYYFETWVRRDGEWFLKELRMERTYGRTSLLMWAITTLQKVVSIV